MALAEKFVIAHNHWNKAIEWAGQPGSPEPLPQKGSPGFQIQQQFTLPFWVFLLVSVLTSRIRPSFPQTGSSHLSTLGLSVSLISHLSKGGFPSLLGSNPLLPSLGSHHCSYHQRKLPAGTWPF